MRAFGVLGDSGLFPGRGTIRRKGAALAGGRGIDRMMRASSVRAPGPSLAIHRTATSGAISAAAARISR